MRVEKINIFSSSSGMILLTCLWLLGLSATSSRAGFELSGSSARAIGMGQAYAGLANTPDAIFINSSGLAYIGAPSVSCYLTRPFGMKELTSASFAAVFPGSIATFGTGFSQLGNSLYREQTLLLAVTRRMRQNVSFGLTFHYMKLQIAGYGSDFATEFDISFLIHIIGGVNWGFCATNINRATMGQQDYLPQTFSSGLSLTPVRNMIFNLDIFKDSAFPLELRTGVEYTWRNRIAFRAGFTTEPAQFCAGFGCSFSYFTVDYAVTTHQNLGLTHHFSLRLRLN